MKDVVVIMGSLPAGDAMAGSGNIAIPTLAGMMLDRGTKSLDKFAIAEKLDDVGAEISFSVGTQSLEIRAKCLKKDLPLVIGLIAEELRTPALQLAGVQQGEAAIHRGAGGSAQNTEARAQEAFGRAVFPEQATRIARTRWPNTRLRRRRPASMSSKPFMRSTTGRPT